MTKEHERRRRNKLDDIVPMIQDYHHNKMCWQSGNLLFNVSPSIGARIGVETREAPFRQLSALAELRERRLPGGGGMTNIDRKGRVTYRS